ncbi:MAG: ferredoxin family protein [Bacteroidia bacterium]
MKELTKENCKDEAGQLIPVVDFNKCESKGPCITECPYDVFEMKEISNEEYSSLSFIGKLKTRYHGREKAVVVRPEQCHACGLCVTSCPEHAIKLKKVN